MKHMLPCTLNETAIETASGGGHGSTTATKHFQMDFASPIFGTARRLLAEESSAGTGYCRMKVIFYFYLFLGIAL